MRKNKKIFFCSNIIMEYEYEDNKRCCFGYNCNKTIICDDSSDDEDGVYCDDCEKLEYMRCNIMEYKKSKCVQCCYIVSM